MGYGVSKAIDVLSRRFAQLWQGFVDVVQDAWGYVTESTQYLLASILQWMEQSWSEIEDYLRKEIGYRSRWLVAIFRENQEVFVGFIAPSSSQGQSRIVSLGAAKSMNNIQLPTKQNPLVRELVL